MLVNGEAVVYGRGEAMGTPLLLRRWSPAWLPSTCLLARRKALLAALASLDEMAGWEPGHGNLETMAVEARLGDALRGAGGELVVDPAAVARVTGVRAGTSEAATPAIGTGGAEGTIQTANPALVARQYIPSVLVIDRNPGGLRTTALLDALRQASSGADIYCFSAATPSFARRVGQLGAVCWGWDDHTAPRDPNQRAAWQQAVAPSLDKLLGAGAYHTVVLAAGTCDPGIVSYLHRVAPDLVVVADTDLATVSSRWPRQPDEDGLLAPSGLGPVLGHAGRAGIILTGSTGRPAVREGIRWWIEEVYPLLDTTACRAEGGTTLRVAGPDTLGVLRDLPPRSGIDHLGLVPDVLPHLQSALALVAPFTEAVYSAEIFAALAGGTPVVATRQVAETLDLDEDDGVLAACDARRMAEAIGLVVSDASRWQELSAAALASPAANPTHEYGHDPAGSGLDLDEIIRSSLLPTRDLTDGSCSAAV